MKYAFGVDVGGTTVKLGFFTREGVLMEKWEIPTRIDNGGSAILPDIARSIDDCLARRSVSKADVLGVGIGVPGPVDDDGNVNRCVNLNWGVFNLHQTLGALSSLPVKAGNDANVAALGEYFDGGGRGSRSMLMVTLGTGIGGGFIWNGQILNGAHGVGCEIGHMTVDRTENALACTCGKRGCAEQYASARAVGQLATRMLALDPRPSLLRAYNHVTARDVFHCAAQQDSLALEVLEQVYDVLGLTIAMGCCMVDPELVVLGGGMSKAGQVLLEGVIPRFEHHMFHACKGTKFALAQLGNDAGIYGCFHLALQAGARDR
ncbi:MAG: ROK family glucokinase [Oscillospiraceae bacterium]|nr:ROK family glucokinase [Oscillospiraceae bacterium]MBR4193442.1 ROK family glucokinase [Oscillospiraceae bacterium]